MRKQNIEMYGINVNLTGHYMGDISFNFGLHDDFKDSFLGHESYLWNKPKYHKEIIEKLKLLIDGEDTELDKLLTNKNMIKEIRNHMVSDFAFLWGSNEHRVYSYKYLSLSRFFDHRFVLSTEYVLECLIEYWNFLTEWEDKEFLLQKLEPAFYYFKKNYDPNKLIIYTSQDYNDHFVSYRINFNQYGKDISFDRFKEIIKWPEFTKREYIDIDNLNKESFQII